MPTAFEFLAHPEKYEIPAVTVLYGDEPYLQRAALEAIRNQVLTGEDAEFSYCAFDGKFERGKPCLEFRSVLDELNTIPLFGGARLVVIDRADDFISGNEVADGYRDRLEHYVAQPNRAARLVILVKSFPSNTRLYKAVTAKELAIECKPPGEAVLLRWLSQTAERRGASLEPAAAELLYEIIGPDMGRLDQELEKLALIVRNKDLPSSGQSPVPRKEAPPHGGKPQSIPRELVLDAVGGWRAITIWKFGDLMYSGQAAEAFVELSRLLEAGEDEIKILAMISAALRNYAATTRIADLSILDKRRFELRSALLEAGVKNYPAALNDGEKHLKQLTRARGRQLLTWLLEADSALKGRNSSGGRKRFVLEELIVKLSKQLAPPG
jgi:DNA polymerase-3 subunit delta